MKFRLFYCFFCLTLLYFLTSCNDFNEENLSKDNTIYLPFIVKGDFSINPLEDRNDITDFLFAPLLKIDKNGTVEPELITSWRQSKDFLTWTFKIRDNASWSDGSPLTSDDVIFTLNYLRDPSLSPYSFNRFNMIDSIKKVDKVTFEIKLKDIYMPFLYILSEVYPVPEHVKDIKNFSSHPICSGPYVLSFIDKKKYVFLSLNPQYWRYGNGKGIKNVLFRIYEDKKECYKDFLSGKIDIVNTISIEDFISLKKQNDFNLYKFSGNNCTFIGLNLDNPLFSDRKVREAISSVIDRKLILKYLLHDYGSAATGPIYPFMKKWYKKTEKFDCNPKKVNSLMEEAGWHKGKNGFYEKNGQVFYFKLSTYKGDSLRERVTTVVSESLLEMGFAVEPVFMERDDFLNALYSKKLDSWCIDFYTTSEPDLMTWFYFYSKSIPQNGGNNYGFYKNYKIDKLLIMARKEKDEKKRIILYFEIQEIIAGDLPVIYLYHKDSICAARKRVYIPDGNVPDISNLYGEFHRWTLNKN